MYFRKSYLPFKNRMVIVSIQAAGYHPDLCFMGVYAIHPEYGMNIPYPEEVRLQKFQCPHGKLLF